MSILRFIEELGAELTETGLAYFDWTEHRVVFANDNFIRIFAISEKQLFENPAMLFNFLKEDDRELVRQQYKAQSASGHFRNIELELQLPEGRRGFVSCDAIMLDGGKKLLLFLKDITRRRSREDYVIKISAQKDTLLDMLTHNLSGPLLVSKDILSTLRQGVDEANVKHLGKMISLVLENTEQCIDIVNDFLKKEHVESFRINVSPTWFDVLEKINIILDKLRELNKKKSFVLTCADAKLPVFTDPVKFFQVMHNLLSNSVKYTKPDGHIEIIVQHTETTFKVTIKDDGIGVDESLRALLFTDRVLGRPGLSGEKSSGLGLNIARRLVNMMEGQLWFDHYNVSNGSVFHIELPRALNGTQS